MPIFARRRLQAAINDLSPHMDDNKTKDLIRRLEDEKRPEQALGAEWELILLWALSRLGDFEVEPVWLASTDKPDAYSGALFDGEEALIEIMTLSDVSISGEKEMRVVAQKICDAANRIKSGSSKHFSFRFQEESGYENGRYFRRRKVSRSFFVTQDDETALRSWIKSGPSGSLRIANSYVDVVVDWKQIPQRTPPVWCSMPPLVHSLNDNPLFKRLREKKRQLKGCAPGARLCIFLADAGSSLLRDLHHQDPCNRTVSGGAIIRYFLEHDGDVDAVVVFSLLRGRTFRSASFKPRIVVTLFVAPGRSLNLLNGLEKIVNSLPVPRFEGYQARSLVQQQAFALDSRSWYSGTVFNHRGKNGPMIVKISSRAMLELMTGKITYAEFAKSTGIDERQVLTRLLGNGFTLSGASLEASGLDSDDDHFVLEFSRDPAASPLTPPSLEAH